jgi:hypothetical protein
MPEPATALGFSWHPPHDHFSVELSTKEYARHGQFSKQRPEFRLEAKSTSKFRNPTPHDCCVLPLSLNDVLGRALPFCPVYDGGFDGKDEPLRTRRISRRGR